MMAGRLKHIIIINEKTVVRGGMGGESTSFIPFTTVRAEVNPVNGSEYYAGNKEISEASHFIRCRYIPGVKADMKIDFNGRSFDIVSVINVREANKELHIFTKELV